VRGIAASGELAARKVGLVDAQRAKSPRLRSLGSCALFGGGGSKVVLRYAAPALAGTGEPERAEARRGEMRVYQM